MIKSSPGRVMPALKWLALSLALSLSAACATSGTSSSTRNRDNERPSSLATKKRRDVAPKNYGIYSARELDRKILRKGHKAMHGPALDSY